MTEEKIIEAQQEFSGENPFSPQESYDREKAFRQSLERHYDALVSQAEELKKEFPEFDLTEALKDREFLRMTAPVMGVSVRGAYYATHAKELNERSARKAAEEAKRLAAKSIAAGAGRPVESRAIRRAQLSSAGSGAAMSRDGRERLKQDIRTAAARGEKIYVR